MQKEINAQVLITQTFGREAPKAAANFAATQTKPYTDAQSLKDNALNALKAETDPQKRAQLEQLIGQADQTLAANQEQYDHWKEGGDYRAILQAAVGGLGGGVSGALGAGATSLAAPLLNELQSGITQKLKDAGASDSVAQLAGQTVSLATASGIGAIAGGGNVTGIAGGLNVDANNRQLTHSEKDRIKQLAGNDKAKEARLEAAACALVKCSAEYPVGSNAYLFFKTVEDAGNRPELQAERALLLQQTEVRLPGSDLSYVASLFQHEPKDTFNDAVKRLNSQYQLITRGLGAVQAVGGVAATITGGTLGIGGVASCAETLGIGCAIAGGGGALTVFGIDQYNAGAQTALSGKPQPTLGAQLLQQVLGTSPGTSELLYGLVGLSPVALDAYALNKTVNAVAKGNEAASLSYATNAPVVTAKGTVNGSVFEDVNQTAKIGATNEPTLIANRVAAKTEATGKQFPNGTTADSHAEIGVIQQAYNAGKTQGAEMSMTVAGKDVCGYCKGDIAAAAEAAGLKSLTVQAKDNLTGLPKIYYWQPGFKSIKEKP